MSVDASQRVQPAIILLDSDDEDQAGPSRPQTQRAASLRNPRGRATPPLPSPGMRRAQVRVNWRQPGSRASIDGQQDRGMPVGPLIDLTGSPPKDDDLIMLPSSPRSSSKKRRKVSVVVEQPSISSPSATKGDEKANPSCAICLEEMSTMACGPCGHVFCDACLRAAVKAQKRCPTCRKVMQPRQIHRVYLNVQ